MTLHSRTARRLALLWTLGIVIACLIPSSGFPEGSSFSFGDKLVHALMFAGFGGLWMHAASGAWPRRVRRVGAAGTLFAVLTEGGQYLLPLGRSPDGLDLLANLVGLGLALACYAGARRLFRRSQNAENQNAEKV